MFEDDEEDLELLRQYEDNSTNGDGHSSEEIDSDLEERLWSIAQYGTPTAGRKKKSADAKTPAAQSQLSSSDEDESDDDEDSSDEDEDEKESEGSDEESEDDKVVVNGLDSLPVTRVVDLDLDQQKKYMDEEEEDEEEYILNNQLQTLIDEQFMHINNRYNMWRRQSVVIGDFDQKSASPVSKSGTRGWIAMSVTIVENPNILTDVQGLPIAPYVNDVATFSMNVQTNQRMAHAVAAA
ncbi:hypothetical protein DFQ30_009193 [Apophysomyces sp. BC1015]|nr:hypothetical protein DFQ30_009193 [Apophysomyces sp. BC1015]